MPAPLHSYSVTGAHAHIRVGLAINACPSTLVFSDWCSRTYTSRASKLCRPLCTRIQCLVLTHTYELVSQSMPAPLHSYSVTCAHAHIRVGLASMQTPPHSYSVSRAHTHIRVGLAINACPFTGTCALAYIRVGLASYAGPSTLVFVVLCSRTYTSWASNQ